MSWVLTLLGIIALIVLHEAGHFFVAKAVGMRVERFSLFFPPKLVGVRRGETEYMIGAIPAGGFVKITGMSPQELEGLDPEVAKRAYYNQSPWKRIAVILAGPGVNLLIAFLLFWAILSRAASTASMRSNASIPRSTPACRTRRWSCSRSTARLRDAQTGRSDPRDRRPARERGIRGQGDRRPPLRRHAARGLPRGDARAS